MILLPLIIAFSAYTMLAARHLHVAFFLFAGLLPTYIIRFDVFGIPTTALEVFFGILFIAWLLRREKRLVDIKGWRLLLLAWVVTATVAVFVSPDIASALGHWKAYFIEPALFFILANDLMRSRDDRRHVLLALAWSAIAVGWFALIQHWTNFAVPPPWDGTEGVRSTSFYGFPNAVGLFLAPLIPLFVGQLPRCRRELGTANRSYASSVFIAATILSFAGLIVAESEGAQIAVLAGLGVMGLMFRKSRWWTVGFAGIAVAVLLVNPGIRSVFVEKATLEDWSGRVRKEIWVETSHMLKDRPILGAGLSGFPIVFAPYHEAGHIEIFQYPHNVILNFWTELGIAGVLVFLLIVIQFFRTAYRNGGNPRDPQPFTVALIGSMVAILVHGLVDVPYLKNDLAFQFWLLVALLSSVTALNASRHEKTSRTS